MSNRPPSKLADFKLVALRSDGFYDAFRRSDQEPLLLRKAAPDGDSIDGARTHFERAASRAGRFFGARVLELIAAFEEDGAFYFALSFFEGRTLAVQMARGRRFTITEAWDIGLKLAGALARQKMPHGGLYPEQVLDDDTTDVRLAPVLYICPPPVSEPTIASDMRQLALLIGHLVFGAAPALPDATGRALADWTAGPEVPARFRMVLERMLAPDGPPYYRRWEDCQREMELAGGGRPASVVPARRARFAFAELLPWAAVAVLLAGGWWTFRRDRTPPVQAASPTETIAAIPAIPSETRSPVTAVIPEPAPPDKEPAAPIGVPRADPKPFLEYTGVMASAMKESTRRDYKAAELVLTGWLETQPKHAYADAVGRQIARIRSAEAAYDALVHRGNELVGAPVELPDRTPGFVTKLEGERLTVAAQTQFGSVSKVVELGSLSDAAVAGLLTRMDAAGEGSLAPAFLLGAGRSSDARALLKHEGAAEDALRDWADEWEALARDSGALAGLDRVAALSAGRDDAAAAAELERVRTAYSDSPIVTSAMAADVYRWDQQFAALAKPAALPAPVKKDGYPGLPKLSLAAAVPIGDPDFKQLVGATQWVIENGGWDRHRDALDQALVSAACTGNWTQHAGNLARILSGHAPSLMLSQNTVLHEFDPSLLTGFAKDKDSKDFLSWLFTNPRAIELLAETLKPEDKPQRVLEVWRDCWKSDREGAEKYAALALAVAVDFDDPIQIVSGFFGTKDNYNGEAQSAPPPKVDPVDRYKFYRDSDTRGVLKVALSDLQPYELAWVVDAPVPSTELVWAQKNVHLSRRDWGKAYGSIRYRMDKATSGIQIYEYYTLAEIKEHGGICGDQAYYAAVTAKANGIPAMVVSGEGDRGGHAWVQWESTRNGWSEAGRYADNYAAGTADQTQTHRTVKEQELHELTAPERRSDGWTTTERYLKLSTLLANAKQPELSRVALDAAVQATPQNVGAWNRLLDALVTAKASAEDWEREIARMRVVFQKFPDIVQGINKRETEYLAASGDAKAALASVEKQGGRFLRKDKSRTDLILDSVYEEAALAEKGGDGSKVGKIYRDALREKGKEAVAFKALAPRYYDWAKVQQQGTEAAREIDQAFERNFKPNGDYFELGAYQNAAAIVVDFYKKEGMEADVHRLQRVLDKVDAKREAMADQAKQNGRDK